MRSRRQLAACLVVALVATVTAESGVLPSGAGRGASTVEAANDTTPWTQPVMPAKCTAAQATSGDVSACLLDGATGRPESRGWPTPPFPEPDTTAATTWTDLARGAIGTTRHRAPTGPDRRRHHRVRRRELRPRHRDGRDRVPGRGEPAVDRHRRPGHRRSTRHPRLRRRRRVPARRVVVARVGVQPLPRARRVGSAVHHQQDRLRQGGSEADHGAARGPAAVRGFRPRHRGRRLQDHRLRQLRVPLHVEQQEDLRGPHPRPTLEPRVRPRRRHEHHREPGDDLPGRRRCHRVRHATHVRHPPMGREDRREVGALLGRVRLGRRMLLAHTATHERAPRHHALRVPWHARTGRGHRHVQRHRRCAAACPPPPACPWPTTTARSHPAASGPRSNRPPAGER